MKILHVSPYYLPHIGGIEKYIERLSDSLIKNGKEVTILSSQIPTDIKNFEILNDIKIKRFKPLLIPFKNPISFKMYNSLLDDINEYDIINCHDEHGFTTNLSAFFKHIKKIQVPLIITSHGCSYNSYVDQNIVEKIYDRTIGYYSLRKADHIISLSTHDKNYISYISNICEDNISVIPNAIQPENYNTRINNDDFINKYNLHNKKILLYVGELTKRKGVMTLLQTSKTIIQKQKNIVYIIVGKGEYLQYMKLFVKNNNLKNNIIFTGRLSDNDLMKAYKSADVFVLPSIVEGVPTVIQEALLFGKPVVATDLPGIHEYFSKYSILVPPNDINKLTNSIIFLFENIDYGKKIADAGKKYIIKTMNWNIIYNKIFHIYKNMKY